jgi:BlaI family transcriptional regulator, penicillinase repressor
MMDRKVNKELLKRDDFHGINLYEANISRPAGMAKLVEFFADRVLEVDASTVVSMFSANETMSKEEIKELEDLLKDIGEDK